MAYEAQQDVSAHAANGCGRATDRLPPSQQARCPGCSRPRKLLEGVCEGCGHSDAGEVSVRPVTRPDGTRIDWLDAVYVGEVQVGWGEPRVCAALASELREKPAAAAMLSDWFADEPPYHGAARRAS